MITTSEIAPLPALAPFIRSYTYREFDTNGTEKIKPWHASHEANIIFFFKDVPASLTDVSTGKILKRGKNCDVVGVSTQYNGDMAFNGKYSFLQILFQPHGFYTLFHASPLEIADKIIWSEDIFNSEIKLLHEQLYEATTLAAMAALANSWLLPYLNKKRPVDFKDRITAAANLITKNAGLVNIDTLADHACMSMRNFERIFISETGMSPKQLCCISRFNNALDLKLNYPHLKWTCIAHKSGYFDQMHLIKDFKRFCGEAPSSLLKHVPLLEEKYLTRISNR
ncbi:MAG: helix-turn-helix domain-containing protein [Ginsengibacter sp.]